MEDRPQEPECVLLCLAINLASLLLDVLPLALHFPRYDLSRCRSTQQL